MTREPLLFLAHRIPYPPDKGDKVRSYHFLRHLAERYRLFLGTFIDDAADLPHRARLEALATRYSRAPWRQMLKLYLPDWLPWRRHR